MLQDDSYVTQLKKLGSGSRNGSGRPGRTSSRPERLAGERGRPSDGDEGMRCTSVSKESKDPTWLSSFLRTIMNYTSKMWGCEYSGRGGRRESGKPCVPGPADFLVFPSRPGSRAVLPLDQKQNQPQTDIRLSSLHAIRLSLLPLSADKKPCGLKSGPQSGL